MPPLSYNPTQYKAQLSGPFTTQESKGFMKFVSSPVLRPLRLLTLAATLMFTAAHADEYADVSQLMRAGKMPEAMAKADQYLAGKPKDPQMRFLKGVIQRDTGKTSDAIGTFTRLTEDYPELPEPYNNLAVLYAGQSQFDKARAALEMAIRTNPSYSTAHENLGDVYAKLASQAYNKALQLDASNPAVPPKLALIRELFSPTGAKGQRPTLPTPALPAPAATAPSVTVATKPPPTLPGPAPAKAPATLPATPPAASTPQPTVVAAAAPSVTTPPPVAQPSPSASNGEKEAEAAVRAWANAWAAKDMKGYLAAYGKEFTPPGSMSRNSWEDERRQRISSKSKISVKLENLTVTVTGNKGVAKFRQDYKANGLAVSSRKTLNLVKTGERWHIVRESTGT
jgi:tetratricopeptide (TPR) repeat protein